MATSQPVQQAMLRSFTINAEYQGRPALTITGSLYDYGDGASRHSVICEAIHDLINGVKYAGGMGEIDGLRLEPVPPPNGRGRPKKTERDVALALAHEWFTTFFETQDKLSHSAARAKAYSAVTDMWEESCWQGAANESALRKNIKKAADELRVRGPFLMAHIAPEPSKSIVIAGQEQDFDLQPYKRMKFSGNCWVWKFGQQHAQYVSASIPETPLFQN